MLTIKGLLNTHKVAKDAKYILDKYVVSALLLTLCLATLHIEVHGASTGKPGKESKVPVPANDTVMVSVDTPALFKQEEAPAFAQWVQSNIKYETGVSLQGRVVFSFIVDTDGLIRTVEVVRGIEPKLDAEILRVVKSSPAWTPAKHKGQKVHQRFTMSLMCRF